MPGADTAQYAIIGAAAMLAVTQRAPLTAILRLTLEFTETGQPLLAGEIASGAHISSTLCPSSD